jgi:hypothetical protein
MRMSCESFIRRPHASALGIETLKEALEDLLKVGSFRLASYGKGVGALGFGW